MCTGKAARQGDIMELTAEQQLEQIELVIKAAKADKDKYETMLRLFENKDFQEIIEKGFFNDFARDLAHTVGNPGAAGAMREEVVRDLQAFGVLKGYFNQVRQQGQQADQTIKQHEAAREEIYKEGLED